jgi:hypothetical protein
MKTLAIAIAALTIFAAPSITFAEYDGAPTTDYVIAPNNDGYVDKTREEGDVKLDATSGPAYDKDLDREDVRLPRIISERGSKNVNPIYDPVLEGSIYRNQGVVETDDSVGRPIEPETFGHGKKVAKTHEGRGVAAIHSGSRTIRGSIHGGEK